MANTKISQLPNAALPLEDEDYIPVVQGIGTSPSTKKVKLSDLKLSVQNERFKGKFTSLIILQNAYPSANAGDYAQVDEGAGVDVINYNWDDDTGWVEGGSGSSATTTDELSEGNNNLYYTQARVSANGDVSDGIAHLARTDNPHTVTKEQIGLSDVDNTSDVSKPISTATQTVLDNKASKDGSNITQNSFRTSLGLGSAAYQPSDAFSPANTETLESVTGRGKTTTNVIDFHRDSQYDNIIFSNPNGTRRWSFGAKGANVGDYYITRYDASGVSAGIPLIIRRATGNAEFSGTVISPKITLTGPIVDSNQATTKGYVDALVPSADNLVHRSGNEIISGTKTFISKPDFSGFGFVVSSNGFNPTTIIQGGGADGPREIELPESSGKLALLSDIPSMSSKLNTDGSNIAQGSFRTALGLGGAAYQPSSAFTPSNSENLESVTGRGKTTTNSIEFLRNTVYDNMFFNTMSNVRRWSFGTRGGGTDADYSITRYDNSGTLIGMPFILRRSTGNADFSGKVTAPKITLTEPIIEDSQAATKAYVDSKFVAGSPVTQNIGSGSLRVNNLRYINGDGSGGGGVYTPIFIPYTYVAIGEMVYLTFNIQNYPTDTSSKTDQFVLVDLPFGTFGYDYYPVIWAINSSGINLHGVVSGTEIRLKDNLNADVSYLQMEGKTIYGTAIYRKA